MDSWASTHTDGSVFRYIPHHIYWAIWKSRNRAIFDEKKVTVLGIYHQILYAAQLPSTQLSSPGSVMKERKKKRKRKTGPVPCMFFPCGFFDGASTSTDAGAGFSVFINENHHLDFALGVGRGTNTKAELMGLWALLLSSQMMSIPLVHIYGDSQVIIN